LMAFGNVLLLEGFYFLHEDGWRICWSCLRRSSTAATTTSQRQEPTQKISWTAIQ